MNAEMSVSTIRVGSRFRKDLGDLRALAASIDRLGLLHPLVVTAEGGLVAGARRLEAVKLLKWKTVPVRVVDLNDLLQAEHDENEVRKDFTASERVAIADAIAERAGERRGRPKATEENPRNCGELDRHQRETAEAAAKGAGFGSKDEYRRAKAVVANGAPELVEAMDAGEVSVSAAAALASLPQDEQREVLAAGPEAATVKAKEVRESQAKGRAAAQAPDYPHSARLYAWVRAVASETETIRLKLGGIGALLAEPDKWDWEEVRGQILPSLEDLAGTISEYLKEISRAIQEGNPR